MSLRSVFFWMNTAILFAFGAQTPFIGVVLETETDMPISDAKITYQSGKEIGKTNAQGRFELELDSKNAKLVFYKEGYDTLSIAANEFADYLDVVVQLVPNVRDLGQSTIISGEETKRFEAKREVKVESLEDAAGMRFDLTEHLSQMPGISGQKDFSSALYYDGSRAGDIAYHLGKLRVPNMRHLDFGFPGNFSVINPHVLSGLEFHDDYGEGPVTEGLATALQYIPDVEEKGLSGRVSAATTMFEGNISTPFFIWNELKASVRVLNPGMLQNMGDKFFSEFSKSDEDCSDCRVSSSDPYNMTAYDGYVQLTGNDSTGDSWALRALYSNDEYTVRQDTAQRLDEVNSVNIIKGSQEYIVLALEYNAPLGTSWHIGLVHENLSDTLRDTTAFRRNVSGVDAALIDAYNSEHTKLTLGLDKKFKGNILNAALSSSLLLDYHFLERSYPDNFNTSTDMNAPVIHWISRLNWNEDSYTASLAGGAVFDFDGNGAPLASLDAEKRFGESFRLFGNAAYRSDWEYSVEGGEMHALVESGTSAKIGAGYRTKYLDFSAHTFGRYYHNPELPTPKAFAHYKELSDADFAWVSGASATLEWKTSHHFSLGTNLGSTYGEYELKDNRSIPFESNARLDMVTHFRYYPRKDSLLSFILSHHAAWHRPLYYYEVSLPQKEGDMGTRKIRDFKEFTDLFRTDFRVNLDITRDIKFINRIRFFVEADNIFANLDVAALRFLGGENARERSQVTRNVSKNGDIELVPLMAKGMGLYLQFGVDILFGN